MQALLRNLIRLASRVTLLALCCGLSVMGAGAHGSTALASAAAPASDAAGNAPLVGLLVGLLVAVTVICGGAGLLLLRSPSTIQTRLGRYVAAAPVAPAPVPAAPPPARLADRLRSPGLMRLRERLGKRLAHLAPQAYLNLIDRLLRQAGPPYTLQPAGFLRRQAGMGLGVLVLFGVWGVSGSPHAPLTWVLDAAVGLVIGCYLPYSQLTKRVAKRRKALLRALPVTLDFLTILVEAGTGFDQALGEVARRTRNAVTEEFALLLVDFQIGKSRREAWRDLTLRTGLLELNAFVSAMVQSEQMGVGIGPLLRQQSAQMRTRRRQHAEEDARTAPVKMLIPMGLFIFPCVMIVILGPALPQIFSGLGNLGH